MRVLITSGAAFIGADVAPGLAARHPRCDLTTLDNLPRRGTRPKGVETSFAHGDIRVLAAGVAHRLATRTGPI